MTYSDIRARARENLRGHWGVSVAAAFVAMIFGALLVNSGNSVELIERIGEHTDAPRITALLSVLISAASAISIAHLVLGGVVQLGYSKFLLAQHDGGEYQVKDLFSQFDRFSVGFLQMLLRNLFVALWSLLLIVPGIIKSYSYAMVPFILADHPDMDVLSAIDESRYLMDGNKWRLFCLDVSFIGWVLLTMVTFGIASIWVSPYKCCSRAAFYDSVKDKE